METRDSTGVGVLRSATGPAVRSGRSPSDPLGVVMAHARDHPRIDLAVLLLVDARREQVAPAASWFASPGLERAAEPLMGRPYTPELPGLVEATLASVPVTPSPARR